MLSSELKSKVQSLWDKFWSSGMTNPITNIEQISYLIFMKKLEQLDYNHEVAFKARKEKYESVFKGHDDCRWSYWKNYNAEQMLGHVRDKVFPFIKNLRRGEDTYFAENMKDSIFLIAKPSLLQEAVSIIDFIFDQEERGEAHNGDLLGDLYEYMLSQLSTQGQNGQFRTPRHIIRAMVQLVEPKLGERICDPACGSGGFLLGAYEYVMKTNTSKDLVEFDADGTPHGLMGDKLPKGGHELLSQNMLYGFDSDFTMVRISLMNMILHGIEHPNIKHGDSLSKNFDTKQRFDVILANPPFTGSIDESDVNENLQLKTTKTELLFVKLIHHLLHVGGKAAVIVPQGVLFGSSNVHNSLRKTLLDEAQLEAVITLPSGVFKPYSGVATAILVFTKGNKTDEVWFYEVASDGYSLDDKRTFIDSKGDLSDLVEKFKKRSVSSKSFKVPVTKIKENDYNFSVSRYKEVEHEKIEYQDPEKLLDEALELEEEIQKEMQDLKQMIKNAK